MRNVVEMCRQNHYQNVISFEWYLTVLMDLSNVANESIGPFLANEIVDIVLRVPSLRQPAVKMMESFITHGYWEAHLSTGKKNLEIPGAAAFIVGEYCEDTGTGLSVLERFAREKIFKLPPKSQSLVLASMIKLLAMCAAEAFDQNNQLILKRLELVGESILCKLQIGLHSIDMEVSRRTHELFVLARAVNPQNEPDKEKGIAVNELDEEMVMSPPNESDMEREIKSPNESYTAKLSFNELRLFYVKAKRIAELKPVSINVQQRISQNASVDLQTPFAYIKPVSLPSFEEEKVRILSTRNHLNGTRLVDVDTIPIVMLESDEKKGTGHEKRKKKKKGKTNSNSKRGKDEKKKLSEVKPVVERVAILMDDDYTDLPIGIQQSSREPSASASELDVYPRSRITSSNTALADLSDTGGLLGLSQAKFSELTLKRDEFVDSQAMQKEIEHVQNLLGGGGDNRVLEVGGEEDKTTNGGPIMVKTQKKKKSKTKVDKQ